MLNEFQINAIAVAPRALKKYRVSFTVGKAFAKTESGIAIEDASYATFKGEKRCVN